MAPSDSHKPLAVGARPGLSPWERGAAGVIGLGTGLLALLAAIDPPQVHRVADLKGCSTAAQCVVSVDADTSTIVVALIALSAAAALLIALLGVRFTKISAAGATLEGTYVSVTTPGEASKLTGRPFSAEPRPRAAQTDTKQDSPTAWDDLPRWAQSQLIAWANEQTAITRPIRSAVRDAAKATGQGNKPWYVTVELDDGRPLTLRVATGRGGTSVAEAE